MAVNNKLTWFAPRKCWKKKIKGKVYYLGPGGVNKSDREAKRQAQEELEEIKATLTRDPEAEALAKRRAEIKAEPLRVVAENLSFDGFEAIRRGLVDGKAEHIATIIGDDGKIKKMGIKGRQLVKPKPRKKLSNSITGLIDEYLAGVRASAKAGSKSMGRYATLLVHLEKFCNWAHDGQPVGEQEPAAIRTSMLSQWHIHLLEQIGAETFSPKYANDLLSSVKQFISWAWEQEKCGLPRNLRSKSLTIPIPKKRPQHMKLSDIRRLLEVASDRTTLYILLALNTGMTAKDISDLHPDELNVRKGTITRARSKTRRHANAPTVTYKLWPQTIKLLKQHRQKQGDRVLLTMKGDPLVRSWIKDDGKAAKVDSIRLAWLRAIKATGRDDQQEVKGTFKLLRATGANLIEQSGKFNGAATLYLAHSPGTVADQHYLASNQKSLDNAVEWLGKKIMA
ncbi:MAG: hypothetical protein AAGI37_04040 [Planctomycetota bacterium]